MLTTDSTMRAAARPRHVMSGRHAALYQHRATKPSRTNVSVAWFALIGVILPFEVSIYLGTAKFTPGRLAVSLLFIPALFGLIKKGRRMVLPDIFMGAMVAWMLCASYYAGGTNSLWSAGAEALEIFAGYVVGRSFFSDRQH